MGTSKLNGTNFTIDVGEADFFGHKAKRLSESRWAVGIAEGVWTPVPVASVLPEIRDCIQGDIAKGRERDIAMLQLAPRQALVFFLEDRITRKHFNSATEGTDYIDIPNVEVEDRILTVRIKKDAEYTVATLDTKGNVI